MNRIDHVVIHINEEVQKSLKLIKKLKESGFPYNPKKGKRTKGFKVSNLWIGKEYLELVSLIKKDGGGWRKDWVDLYHQGHRGAVCLMIDISDIEALSNVLLSKSIEAQIERIEYRLFGLFKISPPWRNLYLPYFANEKFQIGFQQLDHPNTFKKFEKHMTPNSTDCHIMGMSNIVIRGKWTVSDYHLLEIVFPHAERVDQGLKITLDNGSELIFVQASEFALHVELDHEIDNRKEVSIENVYLNLK